MVLAERLPNRPLVMVIDDDADIRECTADVLSDEGYLVHCAANGKDALDQLRSGPLPEVILLDLMMPVMDGWQFRAAQTADPELAKIPVVVLTANAGTSVIGTMLNVPLILRKPVDVGRLLSALEVAAAQRKRASR